MSPREKMIQQLQEARGLEQSLVSTLGAHISMTPDGPYRDRLRRHQQETREQVSAIDRRLKELDAGRNPLELAYGLVQTAAGQAFTLAKGPIDLLRGSSGEDKRFKNAKDEIASEALEIATYDGIEAVAEAWGDTRTAELARRHRAQEEAMLADLRELIPELAGGVARREEQREAEERRNGREESRDGGDGGGTATAGEEPTTHPHSPEDRLPIEGYDTLNADEIRDRLEDLDAEQLAEIDGYERAGRNRKGVLDRIAALRRRRIDEELESIGGPSGSATS